MIDPGRDLGHVDGKKAVKEATGDPAGVQEKAKEALENAPTGNPQCAACEDGQ